MKQRYNHRAAECLGQITEFVMMELDTTNHEVLARTLVRAKASRRLVPGSTAGPYFSTGHENARDIGFFLASFIHQLHAP